MKIEKSRSGKGYVLTNEAGNSLEVSFSEFWEICRSGREIDTKSEVEEYLSQCPDTDFSADIKKIINGNSSLDLQIQNAASKIVDKQHVSSNKSSVSLGKSIYMNWDQTDSVINRWAKSYFGEHVVGFGERDETDFQIGFRSLKPSDYDKFVALLDKYDREHEYEPEDEFGADPFDTIVPERVSLALLHDILPNQELQTYGTVVATYDGIFLMEKDLTESRFCYERDNDVQKYHQFKELEK